MVHNSRFSMSVPLDDLVLLVASDVYLYACMYVYMLHFFMNNSGTTSKWQVTMARFTTKTITNSTTKIMLSLSLHPVIITKQVPRGAVMWSYTSSKMCGLN